MRIQFHRRFEKDYKKSARGIQSKVKERMKLFMENEFSSLLNNHALRGKYFGYRSIDITGDIRAIYKKVERGLCIFVKIGSHSKLYKK